MHRLHSRRFVTIKWVALSLIFTYCKVYYIGELRKCMWHQAILLAVGWCHVGSLDATNTVNQWFLLHGW